MATPWIARPVSVDRAEQRASREINLKLAGFSTLDPALRIMVLDDQNLPIGGLPVLTNSLVNRLDREGIDDPDVHRLCLEDLVGLEN